MRTVFIHGEVDQYSEAKGALIGQFTQRHPEAGGGPAPMVVGLLLEDKLARDGLLARWAERDLERFLVEVAPRRLELDDDWAAVCDWLHLWIDFLNDAGLLMLAGSSVPELHAAVDRAAPAYLTAMAEPSEWGPTKFWSIRMREHGVDTADEEALDRFFAALEEGEWEIDQAVADDIEEREAVEGSTEPAFWLPPVPVPDEEIVNTEAPRTNVLAKMRALHEWIGRGRPLDADGELAEADLDDLAEVLAGDAAADRFETAVLLEWAKHAELARVAGNRLVRTGISAPLLQEPGLLWTRLWQSFVLLEEVIAEDAGEVDSLAGGADSFPDLVQEALCALYSHTDAVAQEFVVDLAARALLEDPDEPDDVPAAGREALSRMLRRVLDQWEAMGVVRRFVTTDDEKIASIDALVPEGVTPDHTMIELMPLGVWAARGSLQAFGLVAPTADEMVGHPAEVLALAIPVGSPDVVPDIVATWIDKRGQRQASAELADLLRRVDDPEVRLTALGLLEHTGAEGVEAVLGLCDDPIAGPSARMWLQGRSGTHDVELREGDELTFSLDGMAIAATEDAETFLSEFRQQPAPNQIAVIEGIPATGHAHAGMVLEVIAEQHPDEQIAAAAGRAMEQV